MVVTCILILNIDSKNVHQTTLEKLGERKMENLVIGFYLILIALIGYKTRTSNAEQYYIGTKSAPWWAIGLSVLATYVSALSFLGGPAWAYGDGMAALAIHVQYPLVLFVCVGLFIPFFYKQGLLSIYDYFEKRFGITTKRFMSLLFMVTTCIAIGSILTATSIAISYATGLDPLTTILAMVLFAACYTMIGGMNAVIWTDVLQAVVMIVVAAGIFFSLYTPDVFLQLDEVGKLSQNVAGDPTIANTIWAGVIAMTFYHITVYGAGQMMVQRVLAAKSIGDAKKAYLFMGYSAFFVYLIFFMIGGMLYLYYDGVEFDNVNTVILQYIDDAAIPGLLGLTVVAVLSASMSSVSSALNSLTTVSMNDFFDTSNLTRARLVMLFWSVASVLVAMQFLNSQGSILEVLSKAGSYFVGAKFAAFYLGFFSKYVDEKGLLIGIVAGFIGVALHATYTDVAWPWYAVLGSIYTIVVAEIVSAPNMLWKREWHKYSVPAMRARLGKATEEGWYLAPGYFENSTKGLLVLFVLVTSWLLWL